MFAMYKSIKIHKMQKIILFIILLVFTTIKAQEFQGKAYYQTKRVVKVSLDSTGVQDAQQKAIQEMIRKQFEKTYILTFNKTESVYKEEEKLETPQPQTGGMIVKIMGLNNTLYKNTKEKTFVDAREEMGKKFLVSDALEPWDWKLEKESKQIGKHLCFKATAIKMVDDYEGMKKKEKQKELLITAWYTPEIPVSNGPKDYFGLPGLILELHEGKMHYICNKLVLNTKEDLKIEAPKKGKVINQKDYDIMMDKQHKKMMENFHNGRKKGKDEHRMTITIGE